jgi:dsRNA-specific ribonuclease
VAAGAGPKPLARGVGTTKKRAEQEAARRAFEKLRKQVSAREPIAEGNGS